MASPRPPSSTGEPAVYRILMVCTGNLCRSPQMERLLVAKIAARLNPADASRFAIRSAGTGARDDEEMEPEAARALVALGGDPTGFVTHRLQESRIGPADLVLTATRDHLATVVTMVPAAVRRTLTLREFARLLGPVTSEDVDRRMTEDGVVERMRAIVRAAHANRGLVRPARPSDDDIADPYRRPRGEYERAAREINEALSLIVDLLAPR